MDKKSFSVLESEKQPVRKRLKAEWECDEQYRKIAESVYNLLKSNDLAIVEADHVLTLTHDMVTEAIKTTRLTTL